jgi:hypothetical protein
MRLFRVTFVAVDKEKDRHTLRVALGIQHAKRMRRIVIRGLSGTTVFFHITY